MQDKHLFEYAVIRVVPKVEREEFMNVGVILFCKKERFLKVVYTLNSQRLQAFSTTLDIAEIQEHLQAYEQISAGAKGSGPIGQLDTPSRFRWLTATRSTVVQSSKVHPGFCSDLNEALRKLHEQLVL